MLKAAIDFETKRMGAVPNPHIDKLLLMGIKLSDGRKFVFEKEEVPDWVLQLVKDPSVLKLCHNLSFEEMFMKHNFGVSFVNARDTLGRERLLTSGQGLSAGLGAVAERRCGVHLNKGIRDNFAYGKIGLEEKEYCLQDCAVLFEIDRQQEAELKSNGQTTVAEIEDYMGLIVGTMQLRGIGFDSKLWKKFVPLMNAQTEQTKKEVWDGLNIPYSTSLFGGYSGGVSLTSRDKILGALEKNGIKLEGYTSGDLKKYLIEFADEKYARQRNIVYNLVQFKKWDKARGWDYPQFVCEPTGRIHCSINAQGADTFRFTASEPNLLQVTKPFGDINFRHLFIAGPGRKIVGADYSQMELRNIAEVAKDPLLLNAFNTGQDMHTLMASKVLKREIGKKDKERNLGKAINFGVRSYGGSEGALIGSALDYGILLTEAQAKQYVKEIRKASQEIQDWGKAVTQQTQISGYIQTAVGHRRYFPEIKETVARNTSIQMFAAGILKEALVEIYKVLIVKYPEAYIILQVHDEILIDAPAEQAEEIKLLVETEMIRAGNHWMKLIPTEVDSYISDSWEK
jgi:DNA polymerase I-like protein with 3'-5' exonuclease and polymerase domains